MYYKDLVAYAAGSFCCVRKCMPRLKPAESQTVWTGFRYFPVKSLFNFERFFDIEDIETLIGDSQRKPSVMQGTCEKKLGYTDGGNICQRNRKMMMTEGKHASVDSLAGNINPVIQEHQSRQQKEHQEKRPSGQENPQDSGEGIGEKDGLAKAIGTVKQDTQKEIKYYRVMGNRHPE